jgi:DNA-binding XRE family transcriptional regulator
MLASEFKEWRLRFGLTQAEAGARFDVSRVTIQNWEKGATPIPVMAESHWLRLARQRPEYGPVILHYTHHLSLRPGPADIVGMEEQFDRPIGERYSTVGKALDRAKQLQGGVWSDFYVADEAGATILNKAEMSAELAKTGAVAGWVEPNSGARTPEEIEARRRSILEFARRFRENADLSQLLTDDDLYDEDGLPK